MNYQLIKSKFKNKLVELDQANDELSVNKAALENKLKSWIKQMMNYQLIKLNLKLKYKN